MAELIGKRYAEALFEAGSDLNKIDDFYSELEILEGAFKEEDKLVQILGHPKIRKQEKKDLVDKIFKESVSQEVLNFLYILIDKNRESNILDIISIYRDLYYNYKGILRVVAITAVPMKDQSRDRLANVLEEKLSKKILIRNKINEDIIGGIRLEIEGKLIDGTIKGKLEAMARTFKAAGN